MNEIEAGRAAPRNLIRGTGQMLLGQRSGCTALDPHR
jgi:hypothetical protein